MRPLVFLFGGQSSRDAQMLERLTAVSHEHGSAVANVVGELDFDTNIGIQTAVHSATIGWLQAVRDEGLNSVASAGLSLGEFAHLVDIDVISAPDCAALVRRRGELYDDGPSGCMAAIYPCSPEELAELIQPEDQVAIAVYNSPTQTVVAGQRESVESLMERADEELFSLSTMIEHRIPMHTRWFEPVAPRLAEAIANTQIQNGSKPYWPNVVGRHVDATPGVIRESLEAHVFNPVLWRQTVDAMVEAYPDAVFLEVGPRTVLRDLMKRKWHKSLDVFAVDAADSDVDPAMHFRQTIEEVKHALG